jgi:hypothetical protein
MTIRTLIVLPLLLAACVSEDPTAGRSQVAVSMSTAEAAAVLALVNYPGTTADVLDTQVGLDPRAAKAIVAHRSGRDGLSPSDDDVLFADLTELDAMTWVGDAAFEKLRTYALAHPVPADEAVEGVLFKGWQAEAVVWAVNAASFEELDAILDSRAATGLTSKRPFASVAAMGAVTNVGPTALTILRTHAQLWWAAKYPLPTATSTITLDGVTFDQQTAAVALEIANLASNYDLVAHGMYTTGAARLVFARPYATLAAVAAVQDVGTASMKVLHDWAASGTWVTPATQCSLQVTPRADAYASDLDQLLELATRADWPYAEVKTLQVSACAAMTDPAQSRVVRDNVLQAGVIDWGYENPAAYLQIGDFKPGAARYLGLMDSARDAIQEHVQAGQWKPADAEQQALLDKLPTLYSRLTADMSSTFPRYYEAVISTDMEECSQYASVLVDTATGKITIIHRFPLC